MNTITNLKHIFKTSFVYSYLRGKKYRYKRKSIKKALLSLSQMRAILISDLNIEKNDSVFIHCGFGFLNASFSPDQLIELIKEIIGPNGHIMMPFYPPGLSSDWILSNRIFDPKSTPCSTGVLAQAFSAHNGTAISCHPTKAVCVWGPHSADITAAHHQTEYPYDTTSPYYKFAMLENSKSIGLGVTNCAMFHCVEDIYEPQKGYLYSPDKKTAAVHSDDGIISAHTFVHHGKSKLETTEQFIDRHFPEICTRIKLNKTIFYSLDNRQLLKHGSAAFHQGLNRICQ